MHCFTEVPPESHLEDLWKEMEVQLKQWMAFEYNLKGYIKLCHEIEFPDCVLHMVINEGVEDMNKAVLRTLQYRPRLSFRLLDWLASFLRHDSICLRWSAIDTLGERPSLPVDILQAIGTRLEHSDCGVRKSAIDALGKQHTLPVNIFQAIVTRLEDSDSGVRRFAINALGKQPTLPVNVFQAIVTH